MTKRGLYPASQKDFDELNLELSHISYVFPEDTNETVIFTAGAPANTFGAWAEIVDNNAVTLSSKFAAKSGHISSFQIEATSVTDKAYLFEIAYGASKTMITPYRFISGAIGFLPPVQQIRIRAAGIPRGETIYYRMKCETGAATCQLSFRYHYH